jgi:hypothetical protein
MALMGELVEDEADTIPEVGTEEEVEGAVEVSEAEEETKAEGKVMRLTSQDERITMNNL